MSEAEETINRIKTHGSVKGIVIFNNKEGRIFRSTFEKKEEGEAIASSIPKICAKARSCVRDLEPTNDLVFLRIKTKNEEIMVAPGRNILII